MINYLKPFSAYINACKQMGEYNNQDYLVEKSDVEGAQLEENIWKKHRNSHSEKESQSHGKHHRKKAFVSAECALKCVGARGGC